MSVFESIIANEYIRFVLMFLGTFFVVSLSYLFLKQIVKRIAGKQKRYEEFILKKLTKPVLLFVFFVGTYSALKSLSQVSVYSEWLDGGFFIVLTLLIAVIISNSITVVMQGYLKVMKGFERTPGLLNKSLSVIIFLCALILILGYFQVDITPMLAGVGLGAVVIGLALQSTLNNFFAGVHLISDKPIEVGNYIEIDENTKGTVEDIGWRSTRIRTLADNLLIIPNGKLAENNITNFSKPKQDMSLFIPCGVAYESDLKKVEKISIEVAREIQKTIDGAVKDFEPAFRYREFGDSNINFITILRVSDPMKRFIIRNEFIKALKQRFDTENIEISWPIRKIYTMK